ncbi:MAG: efflux RND transporter permease subunit [Nitrospiraceae bacterium]
MLISRIERAAGQQAWRLREAVIKGAEMQMRPILMATLSAAIGLLPAALATGIGSQAEAVGAGRRGRHVDGRRAGPGVVLPVLYELVHRRSASSQHSGTPRSPRPRAYVPRIGKESSHEIPRSRS